MGRLREMTNEKRDFDKEAATWDDKPARIKLTDEIMAAVAARISLDKSMNVLDFGCGTGLLTLRMAPFVGTVTGVDASPGMLEVLKAKIAREGIANVRALLLDLVGGDSLDDCYHLIVSAMTFHHLANMAPVLGKLHACLKPGGYLCIVDLDPDGGRFHDDAAGVFHAGFEREAMRNAFGEAGFHDIRDLTAAEVVKPDRLGEMSRFTVFLVTGRK
jgi:cyclopropane fatty-acyl-phospholipid synthase-like methyltransferase